MSQVTSSKKFNVGGSIAHGPITEPKPAAIDPSLTVARFTPRELDIIRKACRDSDFEDAGKLLAAAIKRGDGRR